MQAEKFSNQGHGEGGWSWPSIHPEGRKFAIISGVIALLFFFIGWSWLGWLGLALTIWILAFFRDPKRVTPLDENAVFAPADGTICLIQHVPPPTELCDSGGLSKEPGWRVSIFMSVFDVHINRTPIAGVVKKVVYISGRFINAELDKASEDNERQHILVERADGTKIGFTQIAGLVARRIVAFVKPGDTIVAGQRIGLIRFGSRVDVYLPAGTTPAVLVGQRTVAGETLIARIGEERAVEGVGQ